MSETLLIISGLVEILRTLTSDATRAQAEGRELTAEENARREAARSLIEGEWAALAPKDQ